MLTVDSTGMGDWIYRLRRLALLCLGLLLAGSITRADPVSIQFTSLISPAAAVQRMAFAAGQDPFLPSVREQLGRVDPLWITLLLYTVLAVLLRLLWRPKQSAP